RGADLRLTTQGCGPSALPLGYLGIHRFAVLVSAGRRGGRRFAAGRMVGGLAGIRVVDRCVNRMALGVRAFAASHPGVRTFGSPPRGADLRPFPWATLRSTASRFSFRRGHAMAAASRQAGWWADWRGYASSIDALTEWPW